jgi:class 3 adenylate cyclase
MPTTLVRVGVCGRGSLTAPQQETARLAPPCLNVIRAMSPTLLYGKGTAMAETRKLAAILAADVVGYSRLAGSDEDNRSQQRDHVLS